MVSGSSFSNFLMILIFLELSWLSYFFKISSSDDVDGVRFDNRGINLDITEERVDHGVNLLNIFIHHSIKIFPEFSIVQFLSREMGKRFNRAQGVFETIK